MDVDPDGMLAVQDFDGNWHELSESDYVTVYRADETKNREGNDEQTDKGVSFAKNFFMNLGRASEERKFVVEHYDDPDYAGLKEDYARRSGDSEAVSEMYGPVYQANDGYAYEGFQANGITNATHYLGRGNVVGIIDGVDSETNIAVRVISTWEKYKDDVYVSHPRYNRTVNMAGLPGGGYASGPGFWLESSNTTRRIKSIGLIFKSEGEAKRFQDHYYLSEG
jgi:hypothetical protein